MSENSMTENAKTKTIGRPLSDYQNIFADQVKRLCLLGKVDKEIAEFFNISVRTLNRWKKKYPEFWQSMQEGKAIADADVAHSLYQSAIGGQYVTEERVIQNESGHEIVEIKKQVPANVTAQRYWLNNRQKDKWREKVDVDVEVAINETSIDHLQNLANVMEKAHERQRLLRIERGNAIEGDFKEINEINE